MPKKRKQSLPDKLILIKNPDKGFHEKWTKRRNMLNIPHPFRCLLIGPPNSGKTMIMKNLLMRAKPAFNHVVIVHCTPELTNEYDDCIGAQITSEIPPRKAFDRTVKTLVILEDIDFKHLGKEQENRLNRLYGNWSTHGNISICSTTQDFFQPSAFIKRCTNFFVLWPLVDESMISPVARRVNMSPARLKSLFNLCNTNHDSVWVDKTSGTPYPIRINGYNIPKCKTGKIKKRRICTV